MKLSDTCRQACTADFSEKSVYTIFYPKRVKITEGSNPMTGGVGEKYRENRDFLHDRLILQET